ADMNARKWLLSRFKKMGLDSTMDGAANVSGVLNPQKNKARVIAGSHLDTVPAGGMYDGALGVAAAMECVRVIQESQITLKYPLEIIATSEEEGRFGGMLGSQAIAGQLTQEWLENAYDPADGSLKDALELQGLS